MRDVSISFYLLLVTSVVAGFVYSMSGMDGGVAGSWRIPNMD